MPDANASLTQFGLDSSKPVPWERNGEEKILLARTEVKKIRKTAINEIFPKLNIPVIFL